MPLGLAGPTGALYPHACVAASFALCATALPVAVSATVAATAAVAPTAIMTRALRAMILLRSLDIRTPPSFGESAVSVYGGPVGGPGKSVGRARRGACAGGSRHRRSL